MIFTQNAFYLSCKELLKHSLNSLYAPELQGALNAMLDLLKSVNDSMHQIAITGYEVCRVKQTSQDVNVYMHFTS